MEVWESFFLRNDLLHFPFENCRKTFANFSFLRSFPFAASGVEVAEGISLCVQKLLIPKNSHTNFFWQFFQKRGGFRSAVSSMALCGRRRRSDQFSFFHMSRGGGFGCWKRGPPRPTPFKVSRVASVRFFFRHLISRQFPSSFRSRVAIKMHPTDKGGKKLPRKREETCF